MPIYEYRVRDRGDKVISGRMEASSEEDLVFRLRKSNYVVTSIKQLKSSNAPQLSNIASGGVSRKAMLRFVIKLSNMLQVGLSLSVSIRIISEQTPNKKFKKILDSLHSSIASGTSLSTSLAYYPGVFPDLMVRMVEVGESSGKLTEVLTEYAEYAESQANLREQIKSAMTYPIAVVGLSLVILYLFLTFVIPKYSQMFKSAKVKIPLPTQILLDLSSIAKEHWQIILICMVVFIFGLRAIMRIPKVRIFMDFVKLRLPVYGRIIRKVILARFSETMGVLYQSGVSILESLTISARIAGNYFYSRAINELTGHVKNGKRMSEYISGNRLFNPEIAEMISVGENTGRLSEMLRKTAQLYSKEIGEVVKRLSSLLEPIIICSLAIFIGFLAMAMLMPMLTMVKSMGGG